MTSMRAKFEVANVKEHLDQNGKKCAETLRFFAVAKSERYPDDGHDDDNTYARWSPSASCEIYVANPNLWGQFEAGQKYYVDFTSVGIPTDLDQAKT